MKITITAVRSDKVYRKIAAAPAEKKTDIYRYDLMMPFKKKWDLYHVPMKASSENGYDVIMASSMLGHIAPVKVDCAQDNNVEAISSDSFWKECEESIKRSLSCFSDNHIDLPVTEYLFTILLAEPENPYIKLGNGYSGEGGIPGYISAVILPTDYTLSRLPVCLAHETNHNVRFQFIKWRDDITLGEMIVTEGLAENFAVHLFDETLVGPWVSRTTDKVLREHIKPVIRKHLNVQGLENLNAYLYGDEIAALQNELPVGLPYCAGYACGYYLIRHFLRKTGISITEATLLPAEEILSTSEDFWSE